MTITASAPYRVTQRQKHRTPTVPELQRTLDEVFGRHTIVVATSQTHPNTDYSMHQGPHYTYVWLNYVNLDHTEVGAVLRNCGYTRVLYYGPTDTPYVPHYVIC